MFEIFSLLRTGELLQCVCSHSLQYRSIILARLEKTANKDALTAELDGWN